MLILLYFYLSKMILKAGLLLVVFLHCGITTFTRSTMYKIWKLLPALMKARFVCTLIKYWWTEKKFYIVVHRYCIYKVPCIIVWVHNIMKIAIMGKDRISTSFCNLFPKLGQWWEPNILIAACWNCKNHCFQIWYLCSNSFGRSREHFPSQREERRCDDHVMVYQCRVIKDYDSQ